MKSSFVFVDARSGLVENLLANVPPDAVVVVLDPFQDGLTQIEQALAGVTDLEAVHIISHGAEGTLYLGHTLLNGENIDYYAHELATIGAALSDVGDILLYGCEVAKGVAGRSFIQQLAAFTGADVAASTDYTGAAALKGDWLLESVTGAIQAQALASADFAGLLAPPVLASAGALDTTFDVDGKLTTAIGTADDLANAVALQADGKIVVGGYSVVGGALLFSLARYNSNGTLDTAFDGDGKLTTAIGTIADQISSIAIQADGKIVVAGGSLIGSNYDFALARYNTNGSLDTSFSGDGKLTTAIGTGADFINGIVIQADGKIVAAGSSFNGVNNDFALARYNPDGTLDTTFDADGKVTTGIGTNVDEINSIALQSDGQIVVGGYSFGGNADFALARYNTNGSLDTSFDGDGIRTDAINISNEFVRSIAVQSNGKIIAAGDSIISGNQDFALARYNLDGSLDTTFGTGGKVTAPIGTASDQLSDVELLPDGRIMVVGRSTVSTFDIALARFNASGTLDTTFDGDGTRIESIGTTTDFASALALQANGNVVVAGSSYTGAQADFALMRVTGGPGIPDVVAVENAPFSFTFNAANFSDPEGGALTYTVGALPSWLSFDAATRTFSGTPGATDVKAPTNITVTAIDAEFFSVADTFQLDVPNNGAPTLYLDRSFGGDGKINTPIGTSADTTTSMALLADGSFVIAGLSGGAGLVGRFALVRYNADGTLNTAFGGDGKQTTIAGTPYSNIESIAIQADGKIVAAGIAGNNGSLDVNSDFALVRYNTNGALDTTFDGDGLAITSFSTSQDSIRSIVLQSDGKIVAAGYTYNGANYDIALARYNTNGSLDTTFDGDGKRVVALGPFTDVGNAVALQADGKIVVAGYSGITGNENFALIRLNTDGSLDTTFSDDGLVTTSIVGADIGSALVIQTNGKIIVAGRAANAIGDDDFALARYNTDGSLDTTFDGDGKVITAIGGGDEAISGMALQSDGKIVVAGYSHNGRDDDAVLARYNTNGSLDTTFDGDGILVLPLTDRSGLFSDRAVDLKIKPDGSIVVAGYNIGVDGTFDFTALRLLAAPGIADKSSPQSTPLSHAITGFTDPEGGQLIYSATLTDGSPLPSWINFGGAVNTFSGTPSQLNVGRYDINVTASDRWGAAASDAFLLAITNNSGTTGNDTLYGGLGVDTMTGLAGDDVYVVDNNTDVIVEAPGGGRDRQLSWVNDGLALNVEDMSLMGTLGLQGTGNALDNYLVGNNANNTLNGVDGNDTLVGGAGADFLSGGFGIDVADYSTSPGGVTVSLSLSQATNDGYGNVDGIIDVETLIGSSFGDVLTGDIGANSLIGLDGNDLFDGRTGVDTIGGGLGYDKALYSGLPGTYTISRNGLTTTVSGADGTDTLTGVELLQFAGGGVRALEHAERDFGDDGKSDVLWRNDNGYVLSWNMNGVTIASSPLLAAVSADWKIADGSGDYNGDGNSDVLWRNDNGNVLGWLMDGATIAANPLVASITNDWKIADGAGDYNADGKSDILWRNDNGNVVTWLMDGGTIASSSFVAAVSSDWKIFDGSGDYNGDGKSDVLWRNDNGNVLLWLMDGAAIISNPFVASVPTDWKIADGSGDYNGDGKSDILWRNDNGNVLLWQMNSGVIASSPFVASVPTDWKIADGSSDFNGDGRSDVLWRNDNGNVLTWTMDGATISNVAAVASVTSDWSIQA